VTVAAAGMPRDAVKDLRPIHQVANILPEGVRLDVHGHWRGLSHR
jgi:hypothetical protein